MDHEQFENSYKYKDVCLFLDGTETICTEEYDGRPLVVNAWDDRIVWTAGTNQINRITEVQVFGSFKLTRSRLRHLTMFAKISTEIKAKIQRRDR